MSAETDVSQLTEIIRPKVSPEIDLNGPIEWHSTWVQVRVHDEMPDLDFILGQDIWQQMYLEGWQ